MDELIILLNELFNKSNNSYNIEDIQKLLNLKGENNVETLKCALIKMIEDGQIIKDQKLCFRWR